jgi:hypothetical protein
VPRVRTFAFNVLL